MVERDAVELELGFAQIRPKVLLAVDGYRYGGRDFDRSGSVAEIAAEIPGLERTVRLGYLDPDPRLAGLRDATACSGSRRPAG